MATKKNVPAKKAATAKKAAPAKPATAKKAAKAKPAAKAVKPSAKPAPKASVKPVAKKAAAKPAAKAPAKPAPKPAPKSAPKPAPKKSVAKPTSKTPIKPVAKAPAKSVAKKAAPAKPVAKALAKPVAKKAAPAKPVAKASAKPVVKKAAPAKTVAKSPVKPIAKVASVKVKRAAKPAKAEKPAKVAKEPKPKPEPKPKKVPARKMVQSYRPQEPVKRIIEASISEVKPKKTIAEKFPQSVDTVIAHRVTSEMKRREKEVPAVIEVSPSYNRSLLDTLDDAAPRFRYSDEKLGEFKEVIIKKLGVARKELDFLQGIITRKNEAGTEDTENKFASMEDGSASQDREMLNQLASRQITLVEKLEQALGRVENKTYGVCRATGKLIEENRLKAVPHATLSMEAKNAR
jgi:RNA polymerase-binding transcription factor DksA